tara:strand:- start:254 stop:526 length:273 start_codon:yes stop_codon:yes gene_type:complete
MATHKSARKRSKQSIKKNLVNSSLRSKIKKNINNFNALLLSDKKPEQKENLRKSLSIINSSLSRAVKKGIIKKEFVSRKLSSLSNKLKNI